MNKITQLENEISKLQGRSSELAEEKQSLENAIQGDTEKLSTSMLAGKDDEKLLNGLTKMRIKQTAIDAAITRAGDEVKRLASELLEARKAEAEKELMTLNQKSGKAMAEIKDYLDLIYEKIDDIKSNYSAAIKLFGQFQINSKNFPHIKNISMIEFLMKNLSPIKNIFEDKTNGE